MKQAPLIVCVTADINGHSPHNSLFFSRTLSLSLEVNKATMHGLSRYSKTAKKARTFLRPDVTSLTLTC